MGEAVRGCRDDSLYDAVAGGGGCAGDKREGKASSLGADKGLKRCSRERRNNDVLSSKNAGDRRRDGQVGGGGGGGEGDTVGVDGGFGGGEDVDAEENVGGELRDDEEWPGAGEGVMQLDGDSHLQERGRAGAVSSDDTAVSRNAGKASASGSLKRCKKLRGHGRDASARIGKGAVTLAVNSYSDMRPIISYCTQCIYWE